MKKVDFLIVGGGPAGLSAALTANENGVKDILLVDEGDTLGGQLRKQTHTFFGSKEHYAGTRGIKIAEILSEKLENSPIEVKLNSSAVGIYKENGKKIVALVDEAKGSYSRIEAENILVATGASENMLAFENNDLPGVMGAGAVQTLMNLYGVKPGEEVLMVGSGNVGLIVSYQLIQAGSQVKAVVEALPKIGGYEVHANKLLRMGVPILTKHSIIRAEGENRVEKAIIAELDEKFTPIPGTEQELKVDLICLAVGLNPMSELLSQAGCQMKFTPELGGYVPLQRENLETTIPGIFVAGDASGIEEASVAMAEGRLVGVAISKKLGLTPSTKKEQLLKELEELRKSDFSFRVKEGKEKVKLK